MSADGPPFAVFPGGDPAQANGPDGRDFQELWFSLSGKHWASLVLVPADRGGSAARIATALAAVGTRLRETPVTAIVATAMDYSSVRALTDIQPRLHSNEWTGAIEVVGSTVSGGNTATEAAVAGSLREATPMPPVGRAIIAIQSVVEEPLGVAVAQGSDAVLLCIEMGRSRLRAARRTVELIGEQKLLGALLLR